MFEFPAAQDGGVDLRLDLQFYGLVFFLSRGRSALRLVREIKGFQGAQLLFERAFVHLGVRLDPPDRDRTEGPVEAVRADAGDAVDDVEAADGLAEDGIFPVQVLAVRGILDQVELGAGGFLHRVREVAAAGSGQRSLLVPVFGDDFRIDRIAGAAFAPFLDPGGVTGERIAALDHESVDDPVEQDSVIVMRERQAGKVVPVLGRVLVQFDPDRSHGRDDVEDGFLGQLVPAGDLRQRIGFRSNGLGLRLLRGFRRKRVRRGPVAILLPVPPPAGDGRQDQDGQDCISFHYHPILFSSRYLASSSGVRAGCSWPGRPMMPRTCFA